MDDLSSPGQRHMAGEGTDDMMGGFGDAAGGVPLEEQEREETASHPTSGVNEYIDSYTYPPRRRRGGVNQEQDPQPHPRTKTKTQNPDDKWPEVMFINDYAVFVGYLSMAVRGTGWMVLTWSTVVLLGGFVTMLSKKDFWCLTLITLVQTRVFDVFLNGNISYIGYSFKRLSEAAVSIALPRNPFRKWSTTRGLIRVLVFTIVLCPLFALYMFGLFVSPGISLWRLLQQDYGHMAGDRSKANLKPALVVLYSLALLQGVLFYYKAISSLEERQLLKLVARAYGLDNADNQAKQARRSISDYLRYIRVGCEKDPSFAAGKNLITYAAGLMQSNSPDSYPSGARIIDTLIQLQLPNVKEENDHTLTGMARRAASSGDDASAQNLLRFMRTWVPNTVVDSQRMLMNNMIGSSSSGAFKKFVQMLDYKSQSDGAEIRSRAMRIVAHFASGIHLNISAIQYLASFLSNEEALRHKEKIINILWTLAEDQENLRLMSNTKGLAVDIIEMLEDNSYNPRHHFGGQENGEHGRWCQRIALRGMMIIKRFTSVTKGCRNMQLLDEILQSNIAVSTLQSILGCTSCKMEEELQKSVIMVVTQIASMETSLAVGDEVKKQKLVEVKTGFINSLIGIFLDGSDDRSSVKKLAGEYLAQLSRANENSATILGDGGYIVDRLIKVIRGNSNYRKSAADILKHLCSHYTKDKQRGFLELKNAMIDVDGVIPQVLREVLRRSTTAEPRSYLEELEAFLSLCATVDARLMINQDPDLAARFNKKAKEICRGMRMEVMTFTDLVKKAEDVVEKRRRCSTAI